VTLRWQCCSRLLVVVLLLLLLLLLVLLVEDLVIGVWCLAGGAPGMLQVWRMVLLMLLLLLVMLSLGKRVRQAWHLLIH
jgi:hypothetical protein